MVTKEDIEELEERLKGVKYSIDRIDSAIKELKAELEKEETGLEEGLKPPEMERVLNIDAVYKSDKQIYFTTSDEIAESLKKYGNVIRNPNKLYGRLLFVDSRFNFEEVLEYLKSFQHRPEVFRKWSMILGQ